MPVRSLLTSEGVTALRKTQDEALKKAEDILSLLRRGPKKFEIA